MLAERIGLNNHLSVKTDMKAFVLAGGSSRRMGKNKALLSIDGKTMIEKVIEIVQPYYKEVCVIAKDPQQYQFLNHQVYVDDLSLQSPLIGIYTGLKIAKQKAFFTTCDFPYLSSSWITTLNDKAKTNDVVCFRSTKGLEPFPAIYTDSILSVIEKQISLGDLSIRHMLEGVQVCAIPTKYNFMSINTPQEYALWKKTKDRRPQ